MDSPAAVDSSEFVLSWAIDPLCTGSLPVDIAPDMVDIVAVIGAVADVALPEIYTIHTCIKTQYTCWSCL